MMLSTAQVMYYELQNEHYDRAGKMLNKVIIIYKVKQRVMPKQTEATMKNSV
jgi:hypothetical protein